MTSRMMGPSSPQPKQKMQTSSISNNFVDVQDKRTSFVVRNMFTEKQLRSYEPDNYRPSKRFHELYKSVSESTFLLSHDFTPKNQVNAPNRRFENSPKHYQSLFESPA